MALFSFLRKTEVVDADKKVRSRSAPSPGMMDKTLREGPTRWSEYHKCWIGEGMDLFAWLNDPESYYGSKFSGPDGLEIFNHECDKERAGIAPRRHTICPKRFRKLQKEQERRIAKSIKTRDHLAKRLER